MIAIIFIVAFIIISSFITGRLISQLFFKSNNHNTFLGVGFFAFLGILQPIIYVFSLFGLPTKFMLISLLIVPLIILFLCFYLKVNLYPSKNDMIASLIGLLIIIIGLIRIQTYTLGETYLDSTFYLSMVNENSIKTVYGRMDFYSGIVQEVDFTYDFASFYALFSMLLKLVRNLNISESLQTPIYFYSSTIVYLYFFGITIYTISKRFLDEYIYKILFIIISSFLFFKYYNYALAFIGNSYRTISVSYILMFIYDFFENNENKILFLVGLLCSGLIAVSSSGGFMSLFILTSLIIYLIFKNYERKTITTSLYALIPTLLFLNIVILNINKLIGILLFIFIIIYYFFNRFIPERYINNWYLLHKTIVISLFIIMIVSSYFIQKNSIYPYSFFFNDHSAYDMVHDYFSIYHKNVFYPTLVVWAFLFLYFFTKQRQKDFKIFLIIIIVLFLNPFVTPFIIKFLTNFVFYRAFEIIFNLTTVAIFISALNNLNNKTIKYLLCIISILIVIPFSYKQFTNTYANSMIPSEDYNSYYRITNVEVDLYLNVQELLKNENDRVKVLSQIPSTKAYINNIELLYSVFDTRTSDHYADIKQDAPNELINIFFLREYIGQEIYSTPPKYELMNNLLLEYDVEYLIMSKDQMIENEEGNFMPLYLNIRAIADVIYENDKYVFMKIRY